MESTASIARRRLMKLQTEQSYKERILRVLVHIQHHKERA